MKLKKKAKVAIVIIFIIILSIFSFVIYKKYFSVQKVKEAKVISTIEDYGYSLKDNKNETYRKMFDELKEILQEKEVDYEKYAKKISEMFIYDFYSLEDKIAKNDIGGISFIHKTALPNFLENAESTYYKYVESNIYGNRKQSLPMVDKITLGEIDRVEYAYGEDKTDEEAYVIKVTWNYTKDEFSDYQKEATLTLVKEDKILYIVELK